LWDGKYLAIGDQYRTAPDVYEFSITGSAGTLVNATPLNGVSGDGANWIQGRRILVANRFSKYQRVEVFAYPAGGNPTKIVTKDVLRPLGLTVSLAPR
jgi:hypothetical protein